MVAFLKPYYSSVWIPSIVVPPGLATLSLRIVGWVPVSLTIFAAPRTVCVASYKAVSLGIPYLTPPSARASINMNT